MLSCGLLPDAPMPWSNEIFAEVVTLGFLALEEDDICGLRGGVGVERLLLAVVDNEWLGRMMLIALGRDVSFAMATTVAENNESASERNVIHTHTHAWLH